MHGRTVNEAARALADGMTVDEARDRVCWPGGEVGMHDYAALYAVPGLYEAVYYHVLAGGSPALLAAALDEVVPAAERGSRQVLDVGAGSGMVGEALGAAGFRHLRGVDIEPASALALRRDRAHLYSAARTMDLTDLSAAERVWLAGTDVVTVAGAVGFGHLPVEAFTVLTELLPVGGLLAVTVARDLADDPELAGYAALLLGPAYEVLVRRDGLHRRSATGDLLVTALVLRKVAA